MRKQSPETQNRHLRREIRQLRTQLAGLYEELRQRRLYGGMMANLCYNLAQDSTVPKRYRQPMEESGQNWDAIPKVREP